MWPLCMETLPPMHLNSVQQALADWCAHIHTCALHVHMGAFTSTGWACLLVVRGTARSGQVASHTPTCALGTHMCTMLTVECGLLCGTHTPGVRLGDTRGRSVLSSRRRPTGRPVPSGFGCPSRSSPFPSGSLSLFVFLQISGLLMPWCLG